MFENARNKESKGTFRFIGSIHPLAYPATQHTNMLHQQTILLWNHSSTNLRYLIICLLKCSCVWFSKLSHALNVDLTYSTLP